MNIQQQIHYWAHMLDECFNKDICQAHYNFVLAKESIDIDNDIDKAYFDAIFSGDQRTLKRIVRNYASKKFASSCIGDTILYHGSSEDNIYRFDTTNNQHFLYTFDNKNAALTYTAEEELQFFPLGPMSIEDELNQMIWKQILVLTPVLMKDGKFVVDFKDDQCLIPVLSDRPQYNNDDFDEEICKAYGKESALSIKLKLSDLNKSIPFMTYIPENAKQNLDVEFFIANTETGKMFKDIVAARDYVRQKYNTPSNIHNGVYPLYVMAKNEFDFDANGEVWNGLTFNGEEYQSTDDIAYWASQNNYDIVYIANVEDNPENGIEQAGIQDEYVVMTDSRFIKSALPITYDDNNHIIPLSKRFNFSIDDIRF